MKRLIHAGRVLKALFLVTSGLITLMLLVSCSPSPAPAAPAEEPAQQPAKESSSAQRGPALPHLFWGQVTTTDGDPAAEVEVTAWINGEISGTITTDASGQYGSDPLTSIPDYLSVTGYDGDVIQFRVGGEVAEEVRLGTLVETETRHWEWQELAPSWQAVYQASEVNGLDLVYTPSP